MIKPMDSNQLNKYAKRLRIRDFLGIFASDELSLLPKTVTGFLIFNTDSSESSGQHWISLCITKECIFYFDSLNFNFQFSNDISDFLIKFDRNVIMNALPIQTNDSFNCGRHCLVFCYVMSFKKSVIQYKKWLQTFSSYDIQEREQLSLAHFELINSNAG